MSTVNTLLTQKELLTLLLESVKEFNRYRERYPHQLICLREVDLFKANLQGANLEEVDLAKANLRGANLEEAVLAKANLAEANLEEANLQGANLLRANLWRANLGWANLQGAYLEETDLKGANLCYVSGLSRKVFRRWVKAVEESITFSSNTP